MVDEKIPPDKELCVNFETTFSRMPTDEYCKCGGIIWEDILTQNINNSIIWKFIYCNLCYDSYKCITMTSRGRCK